VGLLQYSGAGSGGGSGAPMWRRMAAGVREGGVRQMVWLRHQHPSAAEVSVWRAKEEPLLLPYSALPSVFIRQICRIAVASGWLSSTVLQIDFYSVTLYLAFSSVYSIALRAVLVAPTELPLTARSRTGFEQQFCVFSF
jgi:hypothetical protein